MKERHVWHVLRSSQFAVRSSQFAVRSSQFEHWVAALGTCGEGRAAMTAKELRVQGGGQSWHSLRTWLVRRCQARVWSLRAREDLADEIIALTWIRFPDGCASTDACKWANALVGPRVARHGRDACRCRVAAEVEIATLPAAGSEFAVIDALDLVEAVGNVVGPGDRDTMVMLGDGSLSNAEIAAARGVSESAVEKSRRRLREVARKLGNDA